MLRACVLARKGLGLTSPNPPVGALLVKEGRIIGRGFHRGAGLPHAEREAIEGAQEPTQGATLYVTLEPCNHTGRTPPCTELILASGISRVVFATKDPNPGVPGNGEERLRAGGILVDKGVGEGVAQTLLAPFLVGIRKRRPYTILKLALSENGYLSTGDAAQRWLSNSASRSIVQRIRARVDAILIGSGTARVDDPLLTNRLRFGNRPVRVVLDSTCSLDPRLQLFDTNVARTFHFSTSGDQSPFEHRGVRTFRMQGHSREEQLQSVMETLFQEDIRSVLCEGGAQLAEALCSGLFVDDALIFRTPQTVPPAEGLPRFSIPIEWGAPVRERRVGCDTLQWFQVED